MLHNVSCCKELLTIRGYDSERINIEYLISLLQNSLITYNLVVGLYCCSTEIQMCVMYQTDAIFQSLYRSDGAARLKIPCEFNSIKFTGIIKFGTCNVTALEPSGDTLWVYLRGRNSGCEHRTAYLSSNAWGPATRCETVALHAELLSAFERLSIALYKRPALIVRNRYICL